MGARHLSLFERKRMQSVTITSQMVKELREKTNAGMMDCKKALTETEIHD